MSDNRRAGPCGGWMGDAGAGYVGSVTTRPCEIGAYPDGPLLVRGTFRMRTSAGAAVDVRRRTIALCRCGRSATAPFCDGTHKAVAFRAPGTGAAGAAGSAAESPSGG